MGERIVADGFLNASQVILATFEEEHGRKHHLWMGVVYSWFKNSVSARQS